MNALIIARLTFKEAARRRILLAALVLGIVFLVVFSLGFHFLLKEILREEGGNLNSIILVQVPNFLLMAGLYVVNFLLVMMTVLTSVDTISGEIGSGTIHTLVAKPVRRRDVFLGKWLGFGGMLTLYLLLMAGGLMAIVAVRSGYVAPHPVRALALLWLNGMLMLSISLLGGTFLSTLANGVMVFGLYGVAFMGGWIEQIGAIVPNESASLTTRNIGILTSLLIPSEALWKRAAFEVQSPIMAALGFTPFTSLSVPSLLMIAYAVLYLLAACALAIRNFNRRDL